MDNPEYYSRQQAIKLSGSTSSRLSYLESIGLIIPHRIGEGVTKKPVVLFTQEQIDTIKHINAASKFLTNSAIERAIARERLPQVIAAIAPLFE